jgi:protease II
VIYWEPAKYVAKMRALSDGAPATLFKINLDAGHGGASGRYDCLREIAFDYTWLLVGKLRAHAITENRVDKPSPATLATPYWI